MLVREQFVSVKSMLQCWREQFVSVKSMLQCWREQFVVKSMLQC